MKTKQFILKKAALALFAILALGLTSCEKDDEGGEGNNPPGIPTSSFEVELMDIRGTSISESEYGELEIYGTISATLVIDEVPEYVELWNTTQQGYISVPNSDLEIGTKSIFTVNTEDLENSELRLGANLMEFDWSNPDEPVGIETKTIQLRNITEWEIFEMSLTDTGGHHVRLRFIVTPV